MKIKDISCDIRRIRNFDKSVQWAPILDGHYRDFEPFTAVFADLVLSELAEIADEKWGFFQRGIGVVIEEPYA